MAKKNQVFIDVVIDDKGTTKRVAVNAKKLGLELDKTSTSARTADRNIKGVAASSSNATKNFSKMAQGTGGLVAAYATLAANIFAISAAYNFLKKAGDISSLTAAQEQYAIKTGTSMKLLTSRMQEATGGMLEFEAASQAAAIGSAAGVSTDQMQSLAKAAKNTSIALGRDLTDSFNRLVKGAIKAEPELLDELGIIVRLDTVTADYAQSINKTAKELTAFERTQAVVNAVLDQTTEKFDDVGENVNQIARLGKSFDDLVKKIMKILNPIAQFTGGVLADNIEALAAAFGILGISIVKGLAPAAPALADITNAADQAKSRMAGIASDSPMGKNIAAGDIGGREIYAMERAANANRSGVLKVTSATKKAVLRDIKIIKAQHQLMIQENSTGWKRWSAGAKAELYSLQAEHGKVMGTMRAGWAHLGRFASRAFNAIAILGMLQLALSFAKEIMDMLKSDELKNIERSAAALTAHYAEQNEAIAEMGDKWKDVGGGMEAASRMANVLANDQIKGLEGMAQKLKSLNQIEGSGRTYTPTDESGAYTGPTVWQDLFMKPAENAAIEKSYAEIVETLLRAGKILQRTGQGSQELHSDLAQVSKAMTFMQDTGTAIYGEEEAKRYSDALATLQERLPGLTKRLQDATKKTISMGNAFIGAVNTGKSFDKMVQKMGQSSSVFSEYIGQLTEVENMFKSMDKAQGNRTFADYFQKEDADAGILNAEGEAILKIIAATDKNLAQRIRGMELSKMQGLIQGQIATVIDEEFQVRLKLTKLQEAFIRAGKGLTKDQNARLQLEYNRQKTLAEMQKIQVEMTRQGTLGAGQDATRTKELTAQQQVLQAQLEVIQRQQDEIAQLGDAATSGLEGSMKTNLAAVLKGEESSIKDAAIKIAQGMIGSVADKLAEQMTGKFMDKLMGVEDPAVAMKNAHVEGSETGKAKVKQALEEGSQLHYDKIVAACEVGANKLAAGVKGQDPSAVGPSPSQSGGGGGLIEKVGASTPGYDNTKDGGLDSTLEEVVVTGSKKKQAGGLAGLFGNFVENLKGLFSGDAPFLDKLGSLFSGLLGDFSGIFNNLFSGLSGMFGQGGTGMGGFFSSVLGIFGFANGGIVKGGFRKYANGGIAKSPHIGVIGEGRYNEAVVPLPDGRSIPVTPGSGMGTNNVTVNVTIDNQGKAESNTESDSSMGADLGKLVAKAVQEELQYQKRSGGILNPYGAA
tara:strand:- start:9740 stop:13357 length:3618 start_codon:yes stop_codon:yes gene_type:complete